MSTHHAFAFYPARTPKWLLNDHTRQTFARSKPTCLCYAKKTGYCIVGDWNAYEVELERVS